MNTTASLECFNLIDGHTFFVENLPTTLVRDTIGFEALWEMHPAQYHQIKIHGRLVLTPRWQQTYGVDYHYTGRVNEALPVPTILAPFFSWTKQEIDQRLNGLLLNWYDGTLVRSPRRAGSVGELRLATGQSPESIIWVPRMVTFSSASAWEVRYNSIRDRPHDDSPVGTFVLKSGDVVRVSFANGNPFTLWL